MGSGDSEKYFEKESGELLVKINPKFYRPAEVHSLCGDPALAEEKLGWKRKVNLKGLVRKMFLNDYRSLNPYSAIKETEHEG